MRRRDERSVGTRWRAAVLLQAAIGAGIVLLTAVGCRTGLVDLGPRKITVRRFDLGEPATEKSARPPGGTPGEKNLAVEPFGASAPLPREFLIRRGETEVSTLNGVVWRDRPELLITAFLTDYLSRTGLFRSVTPVGVGPDPDLILSGVVHRFEWDRGKHGLTARVRIAVQIRRADAGTAEAPEKQSPVVLSTVLEAEVPVKSATPQAMAEAMRRCVQQVCRNFSAYLSLR